MVKRIFAQIVDINIKRNIAQKVIVILTTYGTDSVHCLKKIDEDDGYCLQVLIIHG